MNKRSLVLIAWLYVHGLGAFPSSQSVQANDYWDSQFGISGANFAVAAIHPDGNDLFVSGNFTSINGVPTHKIAKWDGVVWTPLDFQAASGGIIQAITKLGKDLYVGGKFTSIGGVQATNVAKWDGKTWSALGPGLSDDVRALAAVGTNLYAGGTFAFAGNLETRRIAKWDGRKWEALGAGVTKPVTITDTIFPGTFEMAVVYDMVADGTNLYVGGEFERAGEVQASSIAKWDGFKWSALDVGLKRGPASPFNGSVQALAHNGRDLFAGGAFFLAGSTPVRNLARWDGAAWHSLGSGVDDSMVVQALAANANDLYVGGVFREIGGIRVNRLAKWDGSAWSALGGGINPDSGEGGVIALAASDARLFVGGRFSFAGNKPSTNLALWHIPRALQAQRSGGTLTLSWPAPDTNFVLEATESLGGTNWAQVSAQPALQRNRLVVTEKISGQQKFYRLRQR